MAQTAQQKKDAAEHAANAAWYAAQDRIRQVQQPRKKIVWKNNGR